MAAIKPEEKQVQQAMAGLLQAYQNMQRTSLFIKCFPTQGAPRVDTWLNFLEVQLKSLSEDEPAWEVQCAQDPNFKGFIDFLPYPYIMELRHRQEHIDTILQLEVNWNFWKDLAVTTGRQDLLQCIQKNWKVPLPAV